jgi:hypothetical protein
VDQVAGVQGQLQRRVRSRRDAGDPQRPSVTDEERAADAEGRAHFGKALDGFTYVPEAQAEKQIGPFRDPLSTLKREAMILAKELGKLQTGSKVDAAWAFNALELIMLEETGECHWSITNESIAENVKTVINAVKDQIKIAQEKAATREGACF